MGGDNINIWNSDEGKIRLLREGRVLGEGEGCRIPPSTPSHLPPCDRRLFFHAAKRLYEYLCRLSILEIYQLDLVLRYDRPQVVA